MTKDEQTVWPSINPSQESAPRQKRAGDEHQRGEPSGQAVRSQMKEDDEAGSWGWQEAGRSGAAGSGLGTASWAKMIQDVAQDRSQTGYPVCQ